MTGHFPSDGPDPLLVGAAWADDVVHELAAPVAFLDGFIERVARGATPDEEHVSIAAEEVGRLLSLVRSLRRVKPRPGTLRPRSLGEALREAASASECRYAIEVPEDAQIVVDDSYVPHGLIPLLRACARVVGSSGEILVTARTDAMTHAAITIDIVVHADPTAVDDDGRILFVGDMWSSAVAGRASTDVVLAKRIMRAHGHRVTDEADGHTRTLSVRIPPAP
ncbi:hypothetical protein LVJ94_01325 [Pendulispora rubella]|uniref:Uncharacterized protein n=1 Tax=Pendulispora rubella TaxID=2741070 RepID=A0ABZ2L4M8_9BACT